jgi:hypothetical protein
VADGDWTGVPTGGVMVGVGDGMREQPLNRMAALVTKTANSAIGTSR